MGDRVAKTHAPLRGTKVPDVGVGFWVVKIMTTGLGETTSDYFVRQYEPVLIVALAGLALAAAFTWQWLAPRYSKWRYWLTVTLVAVFGTMVADAIHIVIGVPYAVSTATLALLLIVLFVTWYATQRTLSIHSIATRRRELFYWAAVVITFALGTAVGDLTATSLGFGYLLAGVLFLVLFTLPFVGHAVLRWSEISCFWAAYVLTRPLGASFADWVGVSHERGGLGVGTGPISLTLVAGVLVLVAVLKFPPVALSEDRQSATLR